MNKLLSLAAVAKAEVMSNKLWHRLAESMFTTSMNTDPYGRPRTGHRGSKNHRHKHNQRKTQIARASRRRNR